MPLEHYARERPAFRARVLRAQGARASSRSGRTATWFFEDRLTVQYQVQEMLRTERIFEPEGIAEELGGLQPADPRRQQLEGDAAASSIRNPQERAARSRA